MNNTPLNKILGWFESIDKEIQIELLFLCSSFHYDDDIQKEYDNDGKIEKFIAYLNSDSLSAGEVITRSLFTVNLLDFAFCNRDTEEGWDATMDRNLDLRNRMTEKGFSGDHLDNALANWQSRKYFWIGLANSWYELKDNYLTVSELNSWHSLNYKLGS